MSYIPKMRIPIDFGDEPPSNRRSTTTSYDLGKDRIRKLSSTGPSSITKKLGTSSSRVRFKSNNLSSDRLSLSQVERERRKNEALEFLKRETSNKGKNDLRSTSSRYSFKSTDLPSRQFEYRKSSNLFSNRDPASLKTYELLGEKPIDRIGHIPTRAALYDDDTIKNITKESLRRNPLDSFGSYSSTKAPTTFSKYQHEQNNSLLNSLSNFGSKIFRSILYNENDGESNATYKSRSSPIIPSNIRTYNDDILQKELKKKELDLQLEESKRYLNELNKTILEKKDNKTKINTADDSLDYIGQSKTIDKQIENLDNRIQTVLDEVNLTSNSKLLEELGSIKNELVNLRRKQETNNIKFESKFEDMKLENQKSQEKFESLYRELETKKRELDLEKKSLIRLLKDQAKGSGILKPSKVRFSDNKLGKSSPIKNDYRCDENEIGEDGDDNNDDDYTTGYDNNKKNNNNENDYDDENDEDDDQDENDEDVRDILRYILKNKRSKGVKTMRSRKEKINKIKNNLNKIEKASSTNKVSKI